MGRSVKCKTKCHACHGICTLSPLRAALTVRSAKDTQHDDKSKVLRLPRKKLGSPQSAAPATKTANHLLKATQKYCACHTKRLLRRHEVGMSQSATPATQNDMIACFETFHKYGFCEASPIDIAMHQRSQRLETRHGGASKRAFRARLPQISQVAASKSTFSYEFSFEPTSKSTFRARLPSIFITCHKKPRLPRKLHLVTTPPSADNAIHKKHATRDV